MATPKKTGEIRPDLSKPIEVQDKMEVVVKGKKCMLAVDPDTGKLTAYPILPPEGKEMKDSVISRQCLYCLNKFYVSRTMRKHVLCHMRTTKVQISVHIRAV